jgi:cytochrome c556
MRLKLAVVALGLMVAGAAYAEGPDVIKTRQAGQDLLLGDFSGIQQVIALKGDVKKLDKPAAALARWMEQFTSLFPPGSDKGDNTKALPAVWSDRAGFQKAADNFVVEAKKLAELAKAGDAEALAAQAKAVGKACGACHHDYRAR